MGGPPNLSVLGLQTESSLEILNYDSDSEGNMHPRVRKHCRLTILQDVPSGDGRDT